MRAFVPAVLATALLAPTALAQGETWRFVWTKGDVLVYQVEHSTSVVQQARGVREATSSKLTMKKRWKVLDVDPSGVATMRLSLLSLRTEQVRPDGEVLIFDSAAPDRSTPALKEQLGGVVGPPVAA